MLSVLFVFFQAEDGIRGLVRSRGLGDVYKRQVWEPGHEPRLDDQSGILVGSRSVVIIVGR